MSSDTRVVYNLCTQHRAFAFLSFIVSTTHDISHLSWTPNTSYNTVFSITRVKSHVRG